MCRHQRKDGSKSHLSNDDNGLESRAQILHMLFLRSSYSARQLPSKQGINKRNQDNRTAVSELLLSNCDNKKYYKRKIYQ